MPKYLSLFSGIGGFDLAFQRLAWDCAGVCEIDPQAQSVLRRRFPGVTVFDDVHKVGKNTHAKHSVDLVCGGFPCQDLSIAGRRAGLAGGRSGLWFEFARIIDELEPRWVVIENVPGLLSSNAGRDFAVILSWLVQRGYGVCWRVLDAQYFGVPQRRRRVFIVASFGNGRAAQVLFERESGGGDFAQGRDEGQEVAHSLTTRTNHFDPEFQDYVIGSLQAHAREHGHAMTTQQAAESGQLIATREIAQSLTSNYGKQPDNSDSAQGPTLAFCATGVRRLMPVECERLQGFPDGWTDGQSDSARYRQLGNAVAVPVIEWLAQRITEIHHAPIQP